MPPLPSCSPFRPLPWATTLAACTALLLLAVLPPFVAPPLRAALFDGFHLVCHQLPERSFGVRGVPLALCHRCTGIVAGLVVGVVLFVPLGRWRAELAPFERAGLVFVLSLMAADWLLGVGGLWASPVLARVGTGLLVGLVAGYLLARSVAAPSEWERAPVRSSSAAAS